MVTVVIDLRILPSADGRSVDDNAKIHEITYWDLTVGFDDGSEGRCSIRSCSMLLSNLCVIKVRIRTWTVGGRRAMVPTSLKKLTLTFPLASTPMNLTPSH